MVQKLAEALEETAPETMIVLCFIFVVVTVVMVKVVVVVRRIHFVHVAKLDPPSRDLADSAAKHGIGALISTVV